MVKASELQKNVLRFLVESSKQNGYQPSYKEIGAMFNVSISKVAMIFEILEAYGYVQRTAKTRAIKVLKEI